MCVYMHYCSVPSKHPWALKHNLQFQPAWALTWDINCIHLYGSCYTDPVKFGTCTNIVHGHLPRSGHLPGDNTVVEKGRGRFLKCIQKI